MDVEFEVLGEACVGNCRISKLGLRIRKICNNSVVQFGPPLDRIDDRICPGKKAEIRSLVRFLPGPNPWTELVQICYFVSMF